MESGYVICPNCEGRGWVRLGWKFMEGTSEDIRVTTDEKEACEGCRTSKYPGYVYMPPTIDPETGEAHFTKYYHDQQPNVHKMG